MVDFDIVSSSFAAGDTVVDCLEDGLKRTKEVETEASTMDLRREDSRLQTFRFWPNEWGRELARFGFSSINGDCCGRVRCVFCGLEIRDFSSPEEANLLHWESARQYCRYLMGEDVDNVTLPPNRQPLISEKIPAAQTIQVDQAHLLRTATRVPEQRSYRQEENTLGHSQRFSLRECNPETMSRSHTAPQHTKSGEEPATCSTHSHGPNRPCNSVHWTEIVRTARYPRMASYQARLDTLSRWPLLKPSPEELAKAGFFHVRCRSPATVSGPGGSPKSSGECGDSVKCFWCGERLHRWQKTDDAALEHARLSPSCLYVVQVLGQQLHDDIVHSTATSHRQNDVTMPATRHDDMMHSKQSKRSHAGDSPLNTDRHPCATGQRSRLSSSQLDELMRSPSVQLVLQMGFPRQLIRDLLSHNSQRLTADTLCHLALQAAEQTPRISSSPNAAFVPGGTAPCGDGDMSKLDSLKLPEPPVESKGNSSRTSGAQEGMRENVPECSRSGERPGGRSMCKVCSEAEVKVMFQPCNHLVCCSRCTALFTTCPVCHQVIEDVLTVYLT